METPQIFISHSGHDAFEASLLQFAIEATLGDGKIKAWTYQRDQDRSEKEIAESLKKSVKKSLATIFLLSPNTIGSGAAQWMELAYADAFDIKTFILLHHLSFNELKAKESGVPPLLLASQCNEALKWREVVEELRVLIAGVNIS